MKKLKVLLSSVLTCVLAFSLAGCATNDGGGEEPGPDVIVPYSLDVNTSSAKTEYIVGEDYSSAGLVVTLTEFNQTQNTEAGSRTIALTDSHLTIDSSDYQSDTAGTYTIGLSYTESEVTVETSYTVVVKASGVYVSLKSGYESVITLSSEVTSADLSGYADMIEVRRPESDGTVDLESAPLSSDEYTVEVYLNDALVEEDDLSTLGSGAYQIWATLNDALDSGYVFEGFVIVYVVDDLTSITFNSEAEGTLTSQEAGSDVISSTWTFTATYASGATKLLTADDVIITGLTTTVVTETPATANIEYQEVNSCGQLQSAETNVEYTINESTSTVGAINVTIGSAEISALPATIDTETKINDYVSVTAKSDATVTIDTNNKSYDEKSFTHRLKLGGEGKADSRSLKITTVRNNATITIYCMSSSSSASRVAALYDSTFVDKTTTPDAIVGETITVPGDTLYKYEFQVGLAGTYYFACQASGLNVYGIEINNPAPPENVTIGSAEISVLPATIDTETKINDYVSVTAKSDVTVTIDTNNKSYDDKSFTHRLKLGGEGKADSRSLKITTTANYAKIVIYCMSSSSSASRVAALYDGTFVDKTTTPDAIVGETITVPGDILYKYEFNVVEAGTYYFACQASGLNVYGIEIIYS